MTAVVSIAKVRDAELIEVLHHYLEMAEQGNLQGLTIGGKDGRGVEHISIAGCYKRTPALGVNIAMRISWRLTQMQDERDLEDAPNEASPAWHL